MDENLKQEVDRNYDFFRRNLAGMLAEHAGQHALLKNSHIVGYFDGSGAAYRAGLELYPDEIFSIQLVSDEPAELGIMSVAIA